MYIVFIRLIVVSINHINLQEILSRMIRVCSIHCFDNFGCEIIIHIHIYMSYTSIYINICVILKCIYIHSLTGG